MSEAGEPAFEPRDGVGTPDGFRRLWTPAPARLHQGGRRRRAARSAGSRACPTRTAWSSPAGDTVYAVLNLHPYNPGHLMVLPYRHVAELEDLDAGRGRAS